MDGHVEIMHTYERWSWKLIHMKFPTLTKIEISFEISFFEITH